MERVYFFCLHALDLRDEPRVWSRLGLKVFLRRKRGSSVPIIGPSFPALTAEITLLRCTNLYCKQTSSTASTS